MHLRCLLLFALLLAHAVCSYGQDLLDYPAHVTPLAGQKIGYTTLSGVEFLPDPEGKLTVEDVTRPPYLTQFSRDSLLTVGTHTYWLRFKLKNTDDTPLDIGVNPNLLRDYTVYIFDQQGNYTDIRNGAIIPPRDRPQGIRYEFVYLTLAPGQEVLIYIRTLTDFVLRPMVLTGRIANDRIEKPLREILFVQAAAIISILSMMGIYNLFLFFLVKDRVYLYYTLLLSAALLYFIDIDGLSEYLLGISPRYNFNSLVANSSAQVISIFTLYFTRAYYNTRLAFRRWDVVLRLLPVFFICLLIAFWFFHGSGNLILLNAISSISNINIAFSVLYISALSVYAYGKGVQAAKYYLISMGFFFVFVIFYLLHPPFFDVLRPSLLGKMSLKIGFVGQLLLFSFALAARINILKDEINKKQLYAEKLEKENLLNIQKVIEEKNVELEEKVIQRTEDLNQTIEELDTTNEMLKSLHEQVSKKNQDILSSITYASRIQQAMLPRSKELERILGDHFVFYQPKDVVSGDFYWVEEQQDKVFIAVADCTGHGVPGAFMSMIGNELLSQLIINQKLTNSSEILRGLHEGIRKALKQEETNNQDGMDIALVVWDKTAGNLQFSGAHNPLVIIQDGVLQEHKGEKYGIGGLRLKKQRTFTAHTIALKPEEDTYLYLFSDGFQDQFGGQEGRKFMRKNLKALLLDLHTRPMAEQEAQAQQTLNDWMGFKHKQTDDVVLMGLRISG